MTDILPIINSHRTKKRYIRQPRAMVKQMKEWHSSPRENKKLYVILFVCWTHLIVYLCTANMFFVKKKKVKIGVYSLACKVNASHDFYILLPGENGAILTILNSWGAYKQSCQTKALMLFIHISRVKDNHIYP